MNLNYGRGENFFTRACAYARSTSCRKKFLAPAWKGYSLRGLYGQIKNGALSRTAFNRVTYLALRQTENIHPSSNNTIPENLQFVKGKIFSDAQTPPGWSNLNIHNTCRDGIRTRISPLDGWTLCQLSYPTGLNLC